MLVFSSEIKRMVGILKKVLLMPLLFCGYPLFIASPSNIVVLQYPQYLLTSVGIMLST